MRITVDATATLVRSAGVKNYCYLFLKQLRAVAGPGETVSAFPFLGQIDTIDHQVSVRSQLGTVARLATVHAVNRWGEWALDAVLGSTDIFHAGVLQGCAPRKTLMTSTVFDLTPVVVPQHHLQSVVRQDAVFTDRVLRKSAGLIAISENTRQDAIRALGIAPEKIRVVYPGLPDSYYNAKPLARPKPYVIYVGSIEPRKNLSTLLDAWKLLTPALREDFDLVIAGPAGWDTPEMHARVRAESTYLGYVPEVDLPSLIAGATLLAYPSLYEGFGYPVAQAMAAGVPVVTSATSCLPEVTGGAAALIDPRSAAELASAIGSLLESPQKRQSMILAGRQVAERYRWQRCAADAITFFRDVYGQAGR